MGGRESRYNGLLLVVLLAACSGGGGGNEGQSPAAAIVPRFAYVANVSDGTLSMLTVNAATGQLRHNGYVVVGGNPSAVAVDPPGRYVYVANQTGTVSTYSINAANGTLTAVGLPVSAGTTPVAIRVDPTGRYIYVANQGGNVSMYSITPGTGVPSPMAPATIGAGTNPSALAVDPLGRFVYVANQGSGNVSIYTISATGPLVGAGTAGAGTNPSGVDVDPTGRFVYVTNSGGGVSAYSITAGTGALTPVGTGPFPAGTAPRSVSVEPKGRFAYVANQTASGTVSALSIDAGSGALNPPVGGGVSAAGNNPVAVVVDPSGSFLYVANSTSTDITAFQINPSGSLTPLGTVPGRFGPNSIAITKGTSAVTYIPKFAYAANLGSNNISAFRIEAGGALTKTGDFSGTDPFAIAVDPLGKFAYVGNEQVDVNNKSVVSAFTIDSASGALTAVPGSPYTAGTNADSVAVDPSGRFVYVGNVNSNDLSAYTIDAGSGGLTPITLSSSPFLTGGTEPHAVAVEPAGKFLYVANRFTGDVSAFAIDNPTSGTLTKIGSPITTGGSLPFSIAVDPYGRYLYVANNGSGDISAFKIDSTFGSLNSLGTLSSGPGSGPGGTGSAGPRSIAVDAAGRFVYTANENTHTVGAFKIGNDGTLTPVQGTPFATAGALRSVAVDPSGRFVYAGNYSSGNVSAYTIDVSTGPTAGALTEMSNSPFTAAGSPFGMVTSGSIQ